MKEGFQKVKLILPSFVGTIGLIKQKETIKQFLHFYDLSIIIIERASEESSQLLI
jgi:hypothetical protein